MIINNTFLLSQPNKLSIIYIQIKINLLIRKIYFPLPPTPYLLYRSSLISYTKNQKKFQLFCIFKWLLPQLVE